MSYDDETEAGISNASATIGVALIVAIALLAAVFVGVFTPANFG